MTLLRLQQQLLFWLFLFFVMNLAPVAHAIVDNDNVFEVNNADVQNLVVDNEEEEERVPTSRGFPPLAGPDQFVRPFAAISIGRQPGQVVAPSEPPSCGGSLIHQDIVLTSALCFFSETSGTGDRRSRGIRIGSFFAMTGGEFFRQVDYRIHPNALAALQGQTERGSCYSTNDDNTISYLENAVAVIKMDGSSTFTPVTLSRSIPANGTRLQIAGHYLTGLNAANQDPFGQLFLDDLRYLLSNVIPNPVYDDIQEDLLEDDSLSFPPLPSDSFYSVQYDGVDYEGVPLPTLPPGRRRCPVSIGDGEPAVLASNPSVQVGLSIWNCAVYRCPEGPSVQFHTSVSANIDWIEEQICELSDFPPTRCQAPPRKPIICFAQENQVHVKNQGLRYMKDLNRGDLVLVDDEGTYEPIYAFGHKLPDVVVHDYLQITVQEKEAPDVLTVSKDHLVFVKGGRAIPASDIQVGDQLRQVISVNENTDEMITMWSNVTDIQTVTGHGLYAPFTLSGKIVVNGIQVSSFASLQGTEKVHVFGLPTSITHQWLYQTLLMPLRLVQCNPVSNNDRWWGTWTSTSWMCREEEYHDGVSVYLSYALHGHEWWMNQGLFVQVLVGVWFVIWVCAMMALNIVVSYPLLPALLSFVVGIASVAAASTTTKGEMVEIWKS